jgi:hypothetical protein
MGGIFALNRYDFYVRMHFYTLPDASDTLKGGFIIRRRLSDALFETTAEIFGITEAAGVSRLCHRLVAAA